MSRYTELLIETPQTVQSDPRQVPNNTGGYVFEASTWERLDRFLVLGSAENSYYASARALTIENAQVVRACLAEDGTRTVQRIYDISREGRAPKNDPAVFALALALVHGDAATKHAARQVLSAVCRIGTHLFQLVDALDKLGHWGRANKRAVAHWYTDKSPQQLAYQLLKYQARGQWSHRDVLRLAHPRGEKHPHLNAVLRWSVARDARGERVVKRGKGEAAPSVTYPEPVALPPLLLAYDELIAPDITPARAVELVGQHRLTHEMIPPSLKGERAVWEALLEHMPLGALVRNLGQLTARGILADGSLWVARVAERLINEAELKAARIHPIGLLSAMSTYRQGHGDKGKLTWTPAARIAVALERAFYLSFKTVEPTGKNIMLALDVSGSMSSGTIAGVPGLTPREAAAAFAMCIARVEPHHKIVAYAHGLALLPITPDMPLADVMLMTSHFPHQSTDCALPFLWAAQTGQKYDAVISITDSESFAGPVHTHEALRRYRRAFSPGARFVPVALVANAFSVADPSDALSLNVAGFDSAAPQVIADFIRG